MIKVSLKNAIGAVMDARVVDNEDKTREAVIDIISGVGFLSDGDTITIEEDQS